MTEWVGYYIKTVKVGQSKMQTNVLLRKDAEARQLPQEVSFLCILYENRSGALPKFVLCQFVWKAQIKLCHCWPIYGFLHVGLLTYFKGYILSPRKYLCLRIPNFNFPVRQKSLLIWCNLWSFYVITKSQISVSTGSPLPR